MNTIQAAEAFFRMYQKYGFKSIINHSIISNDPTLLYLNSTMVHFKQKMNDKEYIENTVLLQDCFRNNSNSKSLNAFSMIGVSAMIETLSSAFEYLWRYITDILKLNKESIHCVIHRNDEDLKTLWSKFGLVDNIHFTDENDELYSTRWKYGLGYNFYGRGLTLVHDCSDINPCSNNCGIFCGCSKYLQFGNVIIIENEGVRYIDIGCGLERLLSCKYMHDIYSIPEIKYKVQNIPAFIKSIETRNYIYNIIKSLDKMFDSGIALGNHKEQYILKKYIRLFTDILANYSENEYTIENLFPKIEQISFLFTDENKTAKQLFLKQEVERYCNRLFQNIASGDRFIKNSKLPNEEKLLILKERYGLTEQISNNLINNNEIRR